MKFYLTSLIFLLMFNINPAQHLQTKYESKPDWIDGFPDGCTTITVGKLASYDGSVMTSHTDDSHRTRSEFDIMPPMNFEQGSKVMMYKRVPDNSKKMPAYKFEPTGEIPQFESTYGYINTAYPCMNTEQLAIGESTFGGKKELKSDSGLIDCTQLVRLMVERTKTAREAIEMAGDLLSKYGWNDEGECLTIADPEEVWMFEVVGPGENKVGAVWVAQRVPDNHISVNANASRIRFIDTNDKENFMFSENVFDVAIQNGLWNPEDGEFEFCYAYADRNSLAARRREWRVFDLAAPSLKLDPNSENYPFSIKPDSLITLEKMVEIFSDYYEGTEFDMTKNLTVTDDSGKTVVSPLANPQMPYDMNKLLKINGGWGWRGERTIARWYTMYATIIQCRNWLPNEIGGVVWLAWDNVASSIYTPLYSSITKVPESCSTPGRENGYTRKSAWWAFNVVGTLSAQRWGDMRYDVRGVWDPWQAELFENQNKFESKMVSLLKTDKEQAIEEITNYSYNWQQKVFDRAWLLVEELWTKYDEMF